MRERGVEKQISKNIVEKERGFMRNTWAKEKQEDKDIEERKKESQRVRQKENL